MLPSFLQKSKFTVRLGQEPRLTSQLDFHDSTLQHLLPGRFMAHPILSPAVAGQHDLSHPHTPGTLYSLFTTNVWNESL